MKIFAHHLLFLMLLVCFSESGKAQRTIDITDPDFDRSYALFNLKFGGLQSLRLTGGEYAHFNNFCSKYARNHKIKELRKKWYYKDSLSNEYKLSSVEIIKFKKGLLLEEIEIEFLTSRFKHKKINGSDTIKWIIYEHNRNAIRVTKKKDLYHPKLLDLHPSETYFFGKNKNLDSIVLKDDGNDSWTEFFEYDRAGRLIKSNRFTVEYSRVPAIDRIDEVYTDSVKNNSDLAFIRDELLGTPDSSFLIKFKPNRNDTEINTTYCNRIINYKGPYVYWQYHRLENTRTSNFLYIYKFLGKNVTISSNVNLHFFKKINGTSLQYINDLQKGRKFYHTHYESRSSQKENKLLNEVIDLRSRTVTSEVYKILYQVIK